MNTTRMLDLNADMNVFHFNDPICVAGSEGVDAWFVGYEVDEAGARTGRATVTFSEKHPRKCIPIDLAKITRKQKKPVTYKPKPEVVMVAPSLNDPDVGATIIEDHNGQLELPFE